MWLIDGSGGSGGSGRGSRRWGSKVKRWEVEKSREAIQNIKKQENPHVLKNKQTPKILRKKRRLTAVGGCGGRRAEDGEDGRIGVIRVMEV